MITKTNNIHAKWITKFQKFSHPHTFNFLLSHRKIVVGPDATDFFLSDFEFRNQIGDKFCETSFEVYNTSSPAGEAVSTFISSLQIRNITTHSTKPKLF